MAVIITREVGPTAKGSTLSNSELDNNFINLNADIATRIPSSEKGSAGGVATLGVDGLVPSTQLPSYVDDVLEFANVGTFPVTGEANKIYVALDTNKTYRWSGSAYIYITSGAVDSVAGKTGVVLLTNSDVGLGNVENKSASTILSELSSSNVTSALGYTPYNSTNPNGYITSSALSTYLTIASASSTYQPILVSGTNIKTINGMSLLGSGDISSGASVTISNVAPTNPEDGDMWLHSEDGVLLVYYVDQDSSQWIDPQSAPIQGPAGVGVPAGGTTGQVLVKSSNADYATQWSTVVGGGGGSTNPQDLLSPFLLMGA